MLRLAAGSTGPGSSLFHTEQAFPPVKDWSSTATPISPSPDPVQLPEPNIRQEPAPRVVEPEAAAIPVLLKPCDQNPNRPLSRLQ
ncbi:MAG: hypothetical protein HC866_19520 [Leptolyngbyaceae cyanobacterium RU_5_1]|nr:hypothetical protein [Leptolyngbyaceae cyanobacterium RU_5_1]